MSDPPPRRRRAFDPFALLILGTAAVAVLLPPSPGAAVALKPVTSIGVGVVFLLHGARLAPAEVRRGLSSLRLQLAVLALSFIVAPLLGSLLAPLLALALGPQLAAGFVFTSALPSTVQSSVAFVALARGHVAAAVTAAALSNLVGVLASPLLLTLLMGGEAGDASRGLLDAVEGVAAMVLAPFVAGQLLGPLLRPTLVTRAALVGWVDRGVIAALVYQAVGQSVATGVGDGLGIVTLLVTALAAGLFFSLLAATGALLGRALRLSREDGVVLTVCGGMKSMATGLPLLRVLYGDSPAAGLLAVPLVLFHQVQLVILSFWSSGVATRPRDET
jgi:sodium/bile acid cotransporter 7